MSTQSANPIDELRTQVNRLLEAVATESPIAAIVLFQVNEDKEDVFLANAAVLTEETRKLPGCNVFAFHKAVKAGGNSSGLEYLIYENWETRRQFQRQWRSGHLRDFQYSVGDLIAAPPDLRFFHGWRDYRAGSILELAAQAGGILTAPIDFTAQGMRTIGRLLTAGRPVRHASLEPPPRTTMDHRELPPAPGWGPIPFPVPEVKPGETESAATADSVSIGSDDYPFESRYVSVLGAGMHYIEQGRGDPILFLHGNPTWSYVWRNIIPHLSGQGRCIAPDLIGFGRSSKPDFDFGWFDHVGSLEKFIEKLDLRNLTLVLHDQGSAMGFYYAVRNQHNVKAIAFFEALVRPFNWENFSSPEFRALFRAFRTGDAHGPGWKMIVDENVFIEQLLPQASGRTLTKTAMKHYREPFADPSSRIAIWRFARETAIGGEPKDVWSAVSDYSERLQRSPIPKLLLFAEPGALLTKEHVDWCRLSIANLRLSRIGAGLHFLQESSPHEIGQEIASWHSNLCRRSSAFAAAGR